ncbi:MAG: thioesterase [Planctomycetaceae bacterium]|nr:thioesterase [Planctomycetaceae bacterium]
MPTNSTFKLTVRITDGDIDPQGHVNNVAFVRYVQEAAVSHWRAVASRELQAAFTWVVRRHEIEYLLPGLPGDELIVRTWVGEPSGATWERFTEIRRGDGGDRAIVTARTVWVLLDAVSKRPRRVDAGMVAQFGGRDLPAAE